MTKTADLHRMVMEKHTCPHGLKALDLLKRQGFDVRDHHLTTRDQVDAFKAEHGVKTTPQVFIEGQHIGGGDDLRRHLGKSVRDKGATTYKPIIALFAMAALMALAVTYARSETLFTQATFPAFIAISMCLLSVQKLRDVEGFATMFLNYDLLAKRVVPYSYVYPFAEGAAGVLMLAGALGWLSGSIALFIGTIGAVSVFKAVYVDKRELKCACVGGDTSVPLGFVSMTENVMMMLMGGWTLVRAMI
ncbi:MAG: glutaredoxin [Pseudomonadota bacterium]